MRVVECYSDDFNYKAELGGWRGSEEEEEEEEGEAAAVVGRFN